MICSKCGAKVPDNAVVCKKCGNYITVKPKGSAGKNTVIYAVIFVVALAILVWRVFRLFD